MRIQLLILFFQISLCTASYAVDGYTIKGRITGNYSGYIYLSYQKSKDSTQVLNGYFEFRGEVNKPIRAWLNLEPPANIAWVYLENSDITIEGAYSTQLKDKDTLNLYRIGSIKGSHSQDLLDQYRAFCNANRDSKNFNELHYQQLQRMIETDPKHPINGWLLGDLAVNNPIFTYKEFSYLYSLLDTAAMLPGDLRMIKSGLRNLTIYGPGQPFPEFKLLDEANKSIDSKQFRNQFILIDFWASWCGPCRQKHPAIAALQSKFGSRNFKVVSISIDKDTKPWLAAAKKDNITWTSLIDSEKLLVNELGIQAIPFNYLVDQNGLIVSVNSSLEEIETILTDRLK